MFGFYRFSIGAYLLPDAGEIICTRCAKNIVRDEIEKRYGEKFPENVDYLASLALDRLSDLSSGYREETEKAARYFERIGLPLVPVSEYELDEWAYEDPFVFCSECYEVFFPDLVEEKEGERNTLEGFLNSWNEFKDLFGEDGYSSLRTFFDKEDLRRFLREQKAKGLSFPADRFLEAEPFILDDIDGLGFSIDGNPYFIFEAESSPSSLEGTYFILPQKTDAEFRKLWDELFGEKELFEQAGFVLDEEGPYSSRWGGYFPDREDIFSARKEAEEFLEIIDYL